MHIPTEILADKENCLSVETADKRLEWVAKIEVTESHWVMVLISKYNTKRLPF